MNLTIAKCLIHHLRTPDGVRCMYILPYEGNLTERKFEELATRLKDQVGHHYPHARLSEYVPRLKSEWLTGRDKDVEISSDAYGGYSMKGENWFSFGVKEGEFVILNQLPKPIATMSSVTAE